MLVKEKVGNISDRKVLDHIIDTVIIEWYEAKRRILHKKTRSGIDITLKFLRENPDLKEGDILWQDQETLIVVAINPCKCIVITPGDLYIASSVSYEIGNKHLPLFYEGDELLVPYDMPLHNLLESSGYRVKVEERKLSNSFKTTVLPHVQVAGTGSEIRNILQFTIPS